MVDEWRNQGGAYRERRHARPSRARWLQALLPEGDFGVQVEGEQRCGRNRRKKRYRKRAGCTGPRAGPGPCTPTPCPGARTSATARPCTGPRADYGRTAERHRGR
jgi:hypothetical protein